MPAPKIEATEPQPLAERVAEVRRFNRFYTRRIGAIDEGHLKSPLSLAEVRVLYEIANGKDSSAAEVARALGVDSGYLSRLLARLERQGLMRRARVEADGRRRTLQLSALGKSVFAKLDRLAGDDVARLLGPLSEPEQRRLLDALRTVRALLDEEQRGGEEARSALVLRPPRPGDYGWVVQRHGALYAREYGWDERFEGLVAEIVGQYVRTHDPRRERCWIAEQAGEAVGSVFLVAHPERAGVAKLRLLLVEPGARGSGIGRRLVDECVRTARTLGYRTMTLWTNDVLVAARRIYERAGFRLAAEERHRMFGPESVGQTWELAL